MDNYLKILISNKKYTNIIVIEINILTSNDVELIKSRYDSNSLVINLYDADNIVLSLKDINEKLKSIFPKLSVLHIKKDNISNSLKNIINEFEMNELDYFVDENLLDKYTLLDEKQILNRKKFHDQFFTFDLFSSILQDANIELLTEFIGWDLKFKGKISHSLSTFIDTIEFKHNNNLSLPFGVYFGIMRVLNKDYKIVIYVGKKNYFTISSPFYTLNPSMDLIDSTLTILHYHRPQSSFVNKTHLEKVMNDDCEMAKIFFNDI